MPSSVFATSVISTAPGGDPTTAYQATAPTFANGDKIRGHAMFKNGLSLANSAVVTWDGDGIVAGPITFSNKYSTLVLSSDLRLSSTARFEFAPLSSDPDYNKIMYLIAPNKKLILAGDLDLSAGKFAAVGASGGPVGDLTIDGQVRSTIVTQSFFAGSLDPNSLPLDSLTLKNLTLKVVASTPLRPLNSFVNLVFQDINFIGLRTAGTRHLFDEITNGVTIKGVVRFLNPGGDSRVLCGAHTLVVDKNSTLYIDPGVVLSDFAGITLVDATSTLHLNGCDFYTGANGLSLTKGTVIFENKVRIFNKNYDGASNADMTKALIFGNGTAAGDVNVRVLGGAYVTVDGCIKDNHS